MSIVEKLNSIKEEIGVGSVEAEMACKAIDKAINWVTLKESKENFNKILEESKETKTEK